MTLSPRRLVLICLIALGLAPGTFVRTVIDPDPQDIQIHITPLDERGGVRGELPITGAWEITASDPFFGGFSALVSADEGGLLAGSDRGWMLEIPFTSGEPDAAGAKFTYFATRLNSLEEMIDLEAMARDPDTGTLWTAYENFNTVQRNLADGRSIRRTPPEMRRWSANSGPETMVRLADGSFIIIGEAPEGSGRKDRPGLLYSRDPIEDTAPLEFRVATPPKYSPVDATALPDGSVLILLRRLQISIPASFDAPIMRADPAKIVPGGVWSGEVIANLDGPLFGENFEGIAFVPDSDPKKGGGAVYLISDDNLSVFQRSLLVRLEWAPSRAQTPAAPTPADLTD